MNLSGLIKLSNKYGKDPELVLGGGGNTSEKNEQVLYIKCSGTSLATIGEDGFVPVSRTALDATLEKEYPVDDKGREAAFLADVMAARTIPGETRRPSVEALLHNLFPQRYVVHLHPALANGLTCGKAGESKLKELFGESVAWVPATRPGYVLGKLCYDVLREYNAKTDKYVQLAFLENHGIFVAADTEAEIETLITESINKLQSVVLYSPNQEYSTVIDKSIITQIKEKTGFSHVEFRTNPQILEYLKNIDAAKDLLLPFTPDQIVYCGAYPTYVECLSELSDDLSGKILLVEDMGIFALGQTEKDVSLAIEVFLNAVNIAVYAKNFGGAQPLAEDLINFIASWEAESYRQKEAKKR
ncbi:MAG: class II aldolase/adducin family protein [Oscillospiraceae bacterium]|nr:class II aldolase/adducin family protein [Oscillospiraceae bacterium]